MGKGKRIIQFILLLFYLLHYIFFNQNESEYSLDCTAERGVGYCAQIDNEKDNNKMGQVCHDPMNINQRPMRQCEIN